MRVLSLLFTSLCLCVGVVACASSAPRPAAQPRSSQGSPAPYALPDRSLTPGAAGSDMAQICPHVDPALEAARPSTAEKARVFAEYQIPKSQRHLYVIDHDISLSVDGDNVLANLWPQPVAQAKVKDRVESALHGAVCSGKVTLHAAQKAESSDWTTAEKVLGIK